MDENSTVSKADNRKKWLGILVGIICSSASYWVVQYYFFKPPAFDKVMVQIASELNKTCPVMVDNATRLDNAMALPDNIFQYNYTLINSDKAEIDIDEGKKNLEAHLINAIKTSPDMKFFRNHKTTVAYNYMDKNGLFVLKIFITPDKYTE